MTRSVSKFEAPVDLVDQARELFNSSFPEAKPIAAATAPGRVNFIGEHTDYSDGFVLPGAIPLHTAVVVGEAEDRRIRVRSSSFGEDSRMVGPQEKQGTFGDYPLGAATLMELTGRPLRITIHSNLPSGSGLSSSASLLVASVAALQRFNGTHPDPMSCARLARRVENEFVGVPCGFMDQFAVAMGQAGQALLLDCLDNRWWPIEASFPDAEWVVVYSGVRRDLASAGYAHKVEAVQAAMKRIVAVDANRTGILRRLASHKIAGLCERTGVAPGSIPLLEHVASENTRVHLMRHALQREDAVLAGQILQQGHESLSKDFGVSTVELDRFVEEASEHPSVLGVRLTGAGMGGSLVALIRKDGVEETLETLANSAQRIMSDDAHVYRIGQPAQGVRTWML